MPKIIVKCRYIKGRSSAHLSNLIKYIATREGVEMANSTSNLLPATVKQKDLIKYLLKEIPDAKEFYEYHDYQKNPNRKNASEFISIALEHNMDLIGKKENYVDYIATRLGAERLGYHGLFTDAGVPVILPKVQEEVSKHRGNVWTNIISLRREDAERLGYDKAEAWQDLLRGERSKMAQALKMSAEDFVWYAAFHNEGHHPHVHMIAYSKDSSKGYLTKQGIERIRSSLTHVIFRQDFYCIYSGQTKQREQVGEQTKEELKNLIAKLHNGVSYQPKLMDDILKLSEQLEKVNGKKQYGYLRAELKVMVDQIVDELENITEIKDCYKKWMEYQNQIYSFYKDSPLYYISLSKQKEFKHIKNMIIHEAAHLKSGDVMQGMNEKVLMQEDSKEDAVYYLKEENTESIEEWSRQEFQEPRQAEVEKYSLEWSKLYLQARVCLYGSKENKPDFAKAFLLMKQEAEKGNVLAMYDMGFLYQKGIGIEAEEEMAYQWYSNALNGFELLEEKEINNHHSRRKNKSPYLQYRIGKMHQYGLGTSKDEKEASEWLEKASERGHKFAQYSLASLYKQGKGVEMDEVKALHLFLCSAEQGNAYADYEAAKMYREGSGTQRNKEKSEYHFKMAFQGFLAFERERSDDKLLYRIGQMYLTGTGTEKNEEKAIAYLEKAVELENDNAKCLLAKIYIKQEEDKAEQKEEVQYEKIKKAIGWMEKAYERKDMAAAYHLGMIWKKGVFFPADMKKAIGYLEEASKERNQYADYQLGKIFEERNEMTKAFFHYRQSSEQGNEMASYQLGKLYLLGEKVEKNVLLAITYLEQAAEKENQYASFVLGKLFLCGKDIPKDREKAKFWLTESAMQGNPYAAFILEHMDEQYEPNLLIASARLIHYMGNLFEGKGTQAVGGTMQITERKLRSKIRNKKIAQGHAADDHVPTT